MQRPINRLTFKASAALLLLALIPSASQAISQQSVQAAISANNVAGATVSFRSSDVTTSNNSQFSARGLPAGVSIDSDTGVITGTLQQRGVYAFTITETDNTSGSITEQKFRWLVADSVTGKVADENGVVPGQYIVAYRESLQPVGEASVATSLLLESRISQVEASGGIVGDVYRNALVGYSATLSDDALASLQADPSVLYVTPVVEMNIVVDQTNATWGLDRVDQRNLPLNSIYSYNFDGTGVDAYIIDTGILGTHTDFGGRVVDGHDEVGGGWTDCNGHGTHVAGTVGGNLYGVAKNVNLIAVRVLDCNGSGFNTGVIAGVDWAVGRAIATGAPSIGNMSIGGGFSQGSNDAVRRSVEAGIVMVVAAGNNNGDACSTSPSSEPSALTVAATDRNDQRASFSNFGTCVDIHGPGVSVTSAWHTSDSAINTISGTSMASPHGAGIAALYMQANPNSSAPAAMQAITTLATPNVVGDAAGSPNLLMFSDVSGDGGGDPGDPTRSIFFSDDFESPSGWTVNPSGTDTATTGQWQSGDPQQTTDGVAIMQPENASSGLQGMFSNPLAGASLGENDVDGGVTSVQSPVINVPNATSLRLSFSAFLAHLNNASADDFLRVWVQGPNDTRLVMQQLGSAVTRSHVWQTTSVDMQAYANQQIRLLVEVADAGTPSLIEAGIDNIVIDGVGDDGGGGNATLSAADISVNEGDGIASVQVSLSEAVSSSVQVTVFTRPGSALNGQDFFGKTEILTFAAGETSQSFDISIRDDVLSEASESLSVNLTDATGATIANATATVTINDDDNGSGLPQLSLTASDVNEAVGNASVQLSLSAAPTSPVTLKIFTRSVSATPGGDYYGKTENMTIPTGATAGTFSFQILDDSETESTEVVEVRVIDVNGANIASDSLTISILDND